MHIRKAARSSDLDGRVTRRLYNFEYQPSKLSPREIAKKAIKEITQEIQIANDLLQLKFEVVKESIMGYHVLFQQHLFGNLISGAWIRVDIDKTGSIFNITNDLTPEFVLKDLDVSNYITVITIEKAKVIALKVITDSPDAMLHCLKEELVCYPINDTPILAWKLIVKIEQYTGSWKIYIDAKTGVLLDKFSLLKHALPKGRVFDPYPFSKTPAQALNSSVPLPVEVYRDYDLSGLDDSGFLDGVFVSTRLTEDRVNNPAQQFLSNRNQKGFGEVMAYYHIDNVQRYIQQLGFDNIMNKQVVVKVNASEEDNSFYDSAGRFISLGKGGINDAEDAEVIVHEYAHALMEDIVSGFGVGNNEASAMEEAFGDYLAASFFCDQKPAELQPMFGCWNGSPCIRRLDSPKKFRNADMTGNAHKDCEIWSACLWEIRSVLNKEKADRLIIGHLRLLSKKSIFESAAELLITANKQINNGENEAFIREVFVRRKILV